MPRRQLKESHNASAIRHRDTACDWIYSMTSSAWQSGLPLPQYGPNRTHVTCLGLSSSILERDTLMSRLPQYIAVQNIDVCAEIT
ncbi:hypothetical protein RRG08_063838 [Elysia crispata]|uniref:Uncharacterized protein n=1 Tax=Elysia crispata TaxID=231223 RepID=A0AAE0Y5C7_9GAST|nr:hypothetical protein RRG08_063838 [Elysia crispata]